MSHVFCCDQPVSWLPRMPTDVMEQLEQALTDMRSTDETEARNVATLRDILRVELAERRIAARQEEAK